MRALVRDAGHLKTQIVKDGLSGPYRLGAISTALQDYVPDIVMHFRDVAPAVQITVHPGSSQALYEQLVAGRLDAVICVRPPFAVPRDICLQHVADETFVHVSPGGVVHDEVLHALPWILYERSTWGGCLARGYVEKNLGDRPVLCELDSLEAIAAMVQRGLGQAVLPAWDGISNFYPGLKSSGLADDEVLRRSIVLLQKVSSGVRSIDHLLQSALMR